MDSPDVCPRPGYVSKHVGGLILGLSPTRRRLDSFPMTDDGGVLTPSAGSKRRPPAAAKPSEEAPQADPVADVIRAATGLASVGARVANGVAREVVRRIPRP